MLNAFLTPYSFRRWSYNELIPALLYFDQITFVMEGFESRYITTPPSLHPRNATDAILIENHRYYWPLRDFIKEGVIALTTTELIAPMLIDKHWQRFQELINQNDSLAYEYLTSATAYYDEATREQSKLTSLEKAMRVRAWIETTLRFQQKGWEQVTLHPQGYVAFLSALRLFPNLFELSLQTKVDPSGHVRQPPAHPYFATRVVATLLQDELNSFSLEGDPETLSEILEVRRKYEAELQAFRVRLTEAAREWHITDTDLWHTPEAVERYIQTTQPAFEEARRALSDKLRIPKLLLRKGGALLTAGAAIGLGAYIGGITAGPIGAVAGATVGTAASDAIKALIEELGKDTASAMKQSNKSVDKSLVYLLRAQKTLRG